MRRGLVVARVLLYEEVSAEARLAGSLEHFADFFLDVVHHLHVGVDCIEHGSELATATVVKAAPISPVCIAVRHLSALASFAVCLTKDVRENLVLIHTCDL